MIGSKLCMEIDAITSEMIREWDDKNNFGEIYIVKKQILFECVKTKEMVTQHKCLQCKHFYGWSSERYIYCLPNHPKTSGVRSDRKRYEEAG